MIRRRTLLLLVVALAGCRARKDAAAMLPENLAGKWRRTGSREVPAAQAPEPPVRSTVRRVVRADYAGPGAVEVTVYELSSNTAALDAVQRFQHAPGTVFFHKDEYFTVVRWQSADREDVGAFVRALEKHMAEVH
ncbi:MAG TPA: hypothetical protein VN442_13515 [Bryobacteraceae bacterium]|nr:hypothetical protein [Bryobacteraceae bacterium]